MIKIIDKIQMNEFDFLVFFVDLIYMLFAIIACKHFSNYFSNFKFEELIKNKKDETGVILACSFIFFIVLITSNILHHEMHESFFNGLLSIAAYTLLMLLVMLSRKPISLVNVTPDFMLVQNAENNKSSQLYEASCFISSAITLSSIIYYFYELSLSSIFLLCIAIEFFLELIIKLMMILNSSNLKEAITTNNLRSICSIGYFRIHISLILTASACLVELTEDNGFSILISWLLISTTLFFMTTCIMFLLEKLLFRNFYKIYIFHVNVDVKHIIARFLLSLGLDIAMIILLN